MSQNNYESPGFILHSRRFRENSVLLDVLTQTHGRISLIARRSVAKKKSAFNPYQVFNEKLFHWRGRNELQTLLSAEQISSFELSKMNLVCGLYCNELLVKVTGKHIPLDSMYMTYRTTIADLVETNEPQLPLRTFEANLLTELGHALNFDDDCQSHQPLAPSSHYYYHPQSGFSTASLGQGECKVSMAELQALRSHELEDKHFARAAKLVYAGTIKYLLGHKTLNSRELYRELTKFKVS